MRNKTSPIWILLFLVMISLTMTACVRPYPGSEASASQPTQNPITIPAVVIPQEPVTIPETEVATEEPIEFVEPTPEPAEPTAEAPSETTHTVVAGDTLFKIALENGVTVDEIAAANGIADVNSLEVGVILIIPVSGSIVQTDSEETDQPADSDTSPTEETDQEQEAVETPPDTTPAGVHVVQPGDNLYRIGLQYGCSVEQISQHNGIANPNRISVGMEINIPDCN